MEFKKGVNTLFFEVKGEGHPIILLHAMGTDHRSMVGWVEPIFHELNGFSRIYIDLPAHGRSVCKGIRTTQDMLQLILQFIEQVLPNQKFSLIGHSYGGYLAQGILKEKINDVSRVCLLAPAIHKKDRTVPQKTVREKDEVCLASVDTDLRTAFETLMVYQNVENLSVFKEEIQPGRLLADRDFLGSNWREDGYFYSEDPLSAVDCSQITALFIAGKLDSICGFKDYYFLLEKFPNSTLAVLDHAGHLMTIEKRSLVHSLVKDWLQSGS